MYINETHSRDHIKELMRNIKLLIIMIIPILKKYYQYMNNLDTLENKKMASISDTCGIVVNYKTPDLIKNILSNFRATFPELHLVIVDNSNFDRSTDIIFPYVEKMVT